MVPLYLESRLSTLCTLVLERQAQDPFVTDPRYQSILSCGELDMGVETQQTVSQRNENLVPFGLRILSDLR